MSNDTQANATDYVNALIAVVNTLQAAGANTWLVNKTAQDLGIGLAYSADLDNVRGPAVAAAAKIVMDADANPPTTASGMRQIAIAEDRLQSADLRDRVLLKAWKLYQTAAPKAFPGCEIIAKREAQAPVTTRSNKDLTALAARYASK